MTSLATLRSSPSLIRATTLVLLLPVILAILTHCQTDQRMPVYFNFRTELGIEVKYDKPLHVVSASNHGGLYLYTKLQPGFAPPSYRFTGSSNDLGEDLSLVSESGLSGTVHVKDKVYVKVSREDSESEDQIAYWGWYKDIERGRWFLVQTTETDNRAVFTIHGGIVPAIWPPLYYYNLVSCVSDNHCSAFQAYPEDDPDAFVTLGRNGNMMGSPQIQFQPSIIPTRAAA